MDNKYLSEFRKWYSSLEYYKQNDGPAIGTIAASLVVLNNLKEKFDTNLRSHLAPKGTQISGASGKAVAKILSEFGENRPFAKEGGRTNRGVVSEIEKMLNALERMDLANLKEKERVDILVDFQHFLVDRVRAYHNRQKLKLVFDPKLSTWQNIKNLLETASKDKKGGAVAQHLVGAKLQLRFPDLSISNESYSTADRQTRRQGDFRVGDTIFHVTMSPMQGVFGKCLENLKDGLKAFLLIPDGKLAAARQIADEVSKNQISVESLESFISQNIEEISEFENNKLTDNFTELILLYNERVNNAEIDKSLMIELPSNLTKERDG